MSDGADPVTGTSASLAEVLRGQGLDPEELRSAPVDGRARPVRKLLGRDLIVDVAVDGRGRSLLQLEARGRRWAAEHAVRTPRVVAMADDAAWLVSERVHTSSPGGPAYVDACLELARHLSGCEPPALGAVLPTSWRAPRHTLAVRIARAALAGVPLARWRSVRAAAEALPRTTTCHGDFYFRNVLREAGSDELVLVDWEYLSSAPRHTDILRMWSTMKDPEDRARLMDALLRTASDDQRRDIGALAEWLCLRLLAENVTAPARDRNPLDASHARLMTAESRQLAAGLRSVP